MSYNHADPFAPAPSYPSIKFETPGTAHTMTITEIGELRQARDFDTGEPAVSKSGKPKMTLRILVDYQGEDHALWVPQYSNLWKAIQQAREAAGRPLEPLGVLWVQYTGDVQVEGARKGMMAKTYTAKYKGPAAVDLFQAPPNIMAEQIKAGAQAEAPF